MTRLTAGQHAWRQPTLESRWGAVLLLAMAYGIAGLLGTLMAYEPVAVSPMWPAAGIALAALLFFGRNLWPGILLGSFAINLSTMAPATGSWFGGVVSASAIAGGVTLACVLAATLIARTAGRGVPLHDLRSLAAFVGIGALACPLLSAAVGTATLFATGYVAPEHAGAAALSWWLGDVVGVVVVAPPLLLAAERHPIGPSRNLIEALSIFGICVVGGALAFGPWLAVAEEYPLAHLALPVLVWATLRFRLAGAVMGNLLVAAIAIAWTCSSHGPFMAGDVGEALRMLQGFILVVSITFLALGVVLEERAAAERALTRSQAQLENRVASRTAELRRALALQHATFDATADGILVIDMDGHVVSFNERFLELWGIQRDLLVGGTDHDALGAVARRVDDPARFYARVGEIYRRPDLEAEDVLRLDDGRILERHSRPQWLDGLAVGRVWTFRDVTAQRLAEYERDRLLVQEQQARRAAEEAVRVRDDFLSIASHELKTPLTTLKLQLQKMQRSALYRAVETKEAKLLESVVRQSRRLHALIDELLDVSRITTHRISLEAEPTDLAELAEEAVDRLREPASRAGAPVNLDVRGHPEGMWDRIRLEQVVGNLVSNAIKYGGGKPVDVCIDGTGENVVISVKDRGIGISAADQARIFERFERAVASRHYGGFGLGLWIVRQVVEAMGGRIWVESRRGIGSTFRVELPRTLPAARTPPVEAPHP